LHIDVNYTNEQSLREEVWEHDSRAFPLYITTIDPLDLMF